MAGMHLLKLQCRSIVWLLAGLFDGVGADSEPTNTTESDTDTETIVEHYPDALTLSHIILRWQPLAANSNKLTLHIS